MTVVLDSWAVLRSLENAEPAAEQALAIVERATLWTGDPELLVADTTWQWLDLRDAG